YWANGSPGSLQQQWKELDLRQKIMLGAAVKVSGTTKRSREEESRRPRSHPSSRPNSAVVVEVKGGGRGGGRSQI
ncbi:hypothetical protein U1Q18_049682, partial [Sarracenia purpurea var. burkii]